MAFMIIGALNIIFGPMLFSGNGLKLLFLLYETMIVIQYL